MLRDKKVQAKYGSFDFPYSYFYYRELLGDDVNCTNISVDGPIIVPDTEVGVLSYSSNKKILYNFF